MSKMHVFYWLIMEWLMYGDLSATGRSEAEVQSPQSKFFIL